MKGKIKAVVSGDGGIDWLHSPVKGTECEFEWQGEQLFKTTAALKGVFLIADFLRKCGCETASPTAPDFHEGSVPGFLNYHNTVSKYPLKNGSSEFVYRIKSRIGIAYSASETLIVPRVKNDSDAAIVIINDEGNGFSEAETSWPASVMNDNRPVIVYRMKFGCRQNKLCQFLQKYHGKNTILILDANDLRSFGINIGKYLSWERTALDLRWQLAFNQKLGILSGFENIVTVFGLEGAVYHCSAEKNTESYLFFDPVDVEGGVQKKHQGNMNDLLTAFTAVLSMELVHSFENDGVRNEYIKKGTGSALNFMRCFFRNGFGAADELRYDFDAVRNMSNKQSDQISEAALPEIIESGTIDPVFWCILKGIKGFRLKGIAEDIVYNGSKAILSRVPSASYRNYCTVDRAEIESFRSIEVLISSYINSDSTQKPLSIAVFGPPGSGKSFGVTEVAESIAPGKITRVEFNLAQFTSESDLISAFHKVRDIVLKGSIPLVFFDEFDSPFGGPFGWLRFFLAPMQDGIFKDGESAHPIGKAIFVFAGGTCSTYQEFSEGRPEDADNVERQKLFKNCKGPDFVSRLKGFINILGPNPVNKNDTVFIIRRAMLLRSLIERKCKNIITGGKAAIDEDLLKALLHVDRYKHGARSMEALIDMSIFDGQNKWGQSSLPVKDLLSLHVDSDKFTKLMLLDVLLTSINDKIARQIHEEYLCSQKGKKKSEDPSMQPYDQLNGSLKASCISQAADIGLKLQKMYYSMKPLRGDLPEITEFPADEIEEMAEMEHERFCRERSASGWRYAEEKTLIIKLHQF